MDTLEALKAAFRAACAERGIDPVAGATGYQSALIKAAKAKATHHDRMAELVIRHAVSRDMRNGALWDDGYGGIDRIKIQRQQRRHWWVYAPYWRQFNFQGDGLHRPTEVEAIRNIRDEAAAKEGRVVLIEAVRSLWKDERFLVPPPSRRKRELAAL